MATDFPAPPRTNRQATKFPKAILWMLIVAALLAAYFMWACGSTLYRGGQQVNGAARHFHQELNDGQFEQIYGEADAGFRASSSHDELIKVFQNVHTKLGNETAASLINLRMNTDAKGTFIVASYNSTFSGGIAEETFTWVRQGSTLKLNNYDIRSNAFETQ